MRMLRYVKVVATFVVVAFVVLYFLVTVFVLPELGDALAVVFALGNNRKSKALGPTVRTVRRTRQKCGQARYRHAPRRK